MRVRICTIEPAGEGVQDALVAGRVDLVYGPEMRAACGCGSVHVAGGVENRSGHGIGSVAAGRETVQDLLVAAAIEAEYRSEAIHSAYPCCAVNVSRRIERDAAERAGALGYIGKAVENSLGAIGAYSEHGSAAVASASSAAVLGSAVEISRSVRNESGVRVRAITAACETVDNGLVASGIHLEHRSIAICPAKTSCTVQVAGGIQNKSCGGIPSIARAAKTVEDSFRAGSVEFEYDSAPVVDDVASGA